jgi:hypothetical protein
MSFIVSLKRPFSLSLLVIAGAVSLLAQSSSNPGLPSETPDKFVPVTSSFDYAKREVMIPMRDGVKLHTVIIVPKGAKHAPILLTRTPYEASALTSHEQSSHLEPILQGYDNVTDVIAQDGYIRVVQDVRGVGRMCRERGILFHVDAAQGAGKLPLDVREDAIDLLSLTAHKLHGPKGVGALCVRREPRLGLVPLQFGGGQERGLRSGTLPTHQIAGMGMAYRIAAAEMQADSTRIVYWKSQ